MQLIISTHYEGKGEERQTNVASMNKHMQFEMKIPIHLKGAVAMLQGNTKQRFPVM
jgi:hypothetical protein